MESKKRKSSNGDIDCISRKRLITIDNITDIIQHSPLSVLRGLTSSDALSKQNEDEIIRSDISASPSLEEKVSANFSSRVNDNNESVQDFFISIVSSSSSCGLADTKMRSYESTKDHFLDITEAEIEAYKNDVLSAVSSSDMMMLRKFHEEGRPLKCSNKFGESILHLACRRGLVDVARFLIEEAGVPLLVRDDVGRSPLHDACWAAIPNFQIIDLVIQNCPDLLYISDRRGHSPLMYVRQEHWKRLKSYLCEHKLNTFLPKVINEKKE